MWTQRVRQEVEYRNKNPNRSRIDYFIDEIRYMNTYGTMVSIMVSLSKPLAKFYREHILTFGVPKPQGSWAQPPE